MAQLYFRYSTMNAGKSMEVLKIANNYEEQGKRVLLFTHAIDTRYGHGKITSRIGPCRDAIAVDDGFDLFQAINSDPPCDCVLLDEAQFLNEAHVLQLCRVVDELNIPVIAYGLRTDFRANLFPGSRALLCYADKIEEVKTVCWFCHRKALFNMRIRNGQPVREGEQVLIGGNESYLPVCRTHFHADVLPAR
jgi:thymidine kinase